MVLSLDFSSLDASGIENFAISMKERINDSIINFKQVVYCNIPKIEQIKINEVDAISTFYSLWNFIHNNNQKLYVMIDEYDTQVNQFIYQPNSPLNQYLLGETEKNLGEGEVMNSIYRRFFSELKNAMGKCCHMRTIITGVTPIASGYNISTDISHELHFAGICGIPKHDIDKAISSLKLTNDEKVKLKNVIIENYDGYCFHPEQTDDLINPTLFCYIMNQVQKTLKIPAKLMDKNVSISNNGVHIIITHSQSEPVIKQLIIKGTYQINENDFIDSEVDFLTFNENEHSLVQYLYYVGGLTNVKNADKLLKIPNKIARQEFFQKIIVLNKVLNIGNSVNDFKFAVNSLINKKDIKPLCDLITKHKLVHLKFNDVVHSKEQDVKTAFLFTVSLCGYEKQVQNEYYIEKCNKYLDLFIEECLIHCEFKNITTNELNITKLKQWNALTKQCEKLLDKSRQKIFELRVTRIINGSTCACRVIDIWQGLLDQTKENKMFLEQKIKKKVNSFAVLRVGLYVLIYQKF